jgi:hypothetical protein
VRFSYGRIPAAEATRAVIIRVFKNEPQRTQRRRDT